MKNQARPIKLPAFTPSACRKIFTLAIITLLLSLPLSRVAQAAAGDLDQSFGSGGKVTTDIGGIDRVAAIAIQGDGKIVAAGSTNPPGQTSDFLLARYNTDGSLDPSFGTGGKVLTDFFGLTEGAIDVALQSDRRIVAAGTVFRPGQLSNFGLARYNPDGSLDQSFGAGGKVDTDFFGGEDGVSAVLLQRNGKIVVAGRATSSRSNFISERDFALARYNTDGSLDTTFGIGGKVMTDFQLYFDQINGAALDATGRIVAVGISQKFTDEIRTSSAIARYKPDGSLDTTFGDNGKLLIADIGGFLTGGFNDIAVLNNGKLLISVQQIDFTLIRRNSDGSPDTTFGDKGLSRIDFNGSGSISDFAIQRDGKIVATGSVTISNFSQFALARFNSGGGPDMTFGSEGKVTTPFPTSSSPSSVAVQCDGKIVTAGFVSVIPPQTDIALVRYEGDGTGFDFLLQDDRISNFLEINSATGDYVFNNCDTGVTLSGRGAITVQGCVITLSHRTADRNLLARINTCQHQGNAVISTFMPGLIGFSGINDSNTADNSCACR